jgi:outer membrane protein, heavy metal efflux system
VESLTLEAALRMAGELHPDLAEARAEVSAAVGRARQAGVLPNPELVARVEGLALGDGLEAEEEYLVGVAQVLPLGGRLARAREAARWEEASLSHGAEAQRRAVMKRVHAAFGMAMFQERAAALQGDLASQAGRVVDLTRARFELGDGAGDEVVRAELERAGAERERRRSVMLRDRARRELAAALGDPGLEIAGLEGELEGVLELDTLELIAGELELHPEAEAARGELEARRARIDWAKAERIPDVRVELLYRRVGSARGNAMDVGLTVPLPVWDRQQGRLRSARAEYEAAEARSRAVRLGLERRWWEAEGRLSAALAEARWYQAELLPRWGRVWETVGRRREAGDVGAVEVVRVARERAEVELGYLEVLREALEAWAELRALGAAG